MSRVTIPRVGGVAGALLVVLGPLGLSCKQDPPAPLVSSSQAQAMGRAVEAHLQTLAGLPDLLPPEPEEGTKLCLILFDLGPGKRQLPRGPFPAGKGTLAFERERAALLRAAPEHWVIMTDQPGDRLLYWAPIGQPDGVRFETRPDRAWGPRESQVAQGRESLVPVQLPFIPGALVALVSPASWAGRIEADQVLPLGPDGPRHGSRRRGPP